MFQRYIPMRLLYSLPPRLGKYDAREAKVMQKIINGSLTKKKSWYRPDGINNATTMSLPSPTSLHQGGRSSRRVAVLNKLFMRHISDLMATGEVAGELIGRGIEISRVKVASDFTRVNVYWLAKGTRHDTQTETILFRNAHRLRHELSQLRIIGSVPLIEFVKDKRYGQMGDVEHLLAKADFGDDFVAVDPSHYLKSEFILNTQFPGNVKEELEFGSEVDDIPAEPIPAMRMDVLGLNHLDIMTKIRKSMKKSLALHRLESELQPTSKQDLQQAPSLSTEKVILSKAALTEFLLQRQRMKQKALRGVKNYQPELEFYEQKQEEREIKLSLFSDEMDTVDEASEIEEKSEYVP